MTKIIITEFQEKWDNARKVCPEIDNIDKWIQNISQLSQKLDKDNEHCDTIGYEDAISSGDKVE